MGDAKRKSRALVNKAPLPSAAEVQATVERRLRALENKIGPPLKFDQEPKTKKHMSFIGGNGRIYIQPRVDGCYDVSLSGQSLVNKMSAFMDCLCGKMRGYKHKNRQPFWRVDDFETVEKAVRKYAETRA